MSRIFSPDSLRHSKTYSSYAGVDLIEIFNREIQVANSVVGGRSHGYPAVSINTEQNPTQKFCHNTRYELWNDRYSYSNQSKETMSEHYYLDLVVIGPPQNDLYAVAFLPEKGKPAIYCTDTSYIAYFVTTNRPLYNLLTSKTSSFYLNLWTQDGTSTMTIIKVHARQLEFSPELINFMKNALWYKEFGTFPLQDVFENTAIVNAPDLLEGL